MAEVDEAQELFPLDEAVDAPGTERRPRPPGFVLAVSLAVVFGLLAVGFALFAAAGRDAGATDRRQAFSLAGRFSETLFTNDFRDPEAARERVKGMATGSFLDEYEKVFEPLIGPNIEKLQFRSTAKVQDVFLSEIDSGNAVGLVVIDIEATGSAGTTVFNDLYLRLAMLKVEGRWKVDSVTYLIFDQTQVNSGSTTTTAAGSPATSVP
jgi:hypothetical protein